MATDVCAMCGAKRIPWAGGTHYRASDDGVVPACTLSDQEIRNRDWAALYGPAYFEGD